jgi:hypothetical protein
MHMHNKLAIVLIALPIGAISLFAKSASAAEGSFQPQANSSVLIADRDDNQGNGYDQRLDAQHERVRQDQLRLEQARLRQEQLRRDQIRQDELRREQARRVWIPGHWEPGFLGIGRHWVDGHWENRA